MNFFKIFPIENILKTNSNRDKSLTYGPSYKMLLPENRSPQEAYQDMVLWYNEQVKGWENTMAGNEQAKIKAIEDSKTWKDKNISFDSGAKIESSTKTCTGQTIDMEWEIETLVVLGYETGFEINKTGVGLTTRTETGGTAIHSESSSSEYCNEIGYILAEDGDDDALTVDVFRAPDGFGAIFSTLGGQTCCPYEGEVVSKYYNPGTQLSAATMRIEWPEILPISQTVTDVPSGKSANFTLVLNNLSETNEDVWFTLAMLDETNPNGAQLSIDGAKLTDGRDILVRANETLTKSLQLTQTSLDVLEYKDIKIVLKSKCQADPTGVHEVIADTATLSAYFVPTCSDITLNIENRIINARSSDTLSMQILDLDRTFDNFKYVRIQYKGLSDVNWSLAKEYAVNSSDVDSNNELLPSGGRINYQLPMSNTSLFPDQTYLFRSITVCSFGIETVINESETIEVIKDMSIPQVLGTPAPSNGILEVGDDISLTFNETIRSTSLSKDDNFIVTGILNDAQIAHDVAFTLEGTATPAVTAADIRLSNQSFAFDVWVNYNGEGTLFSHGNGQNKFVVNITNENKMEVIIGQSSYISTLTIPQNKWIFITLNYLYDAQIPRLSVMFADDDMTQMLFNSLSVNSYEGHGAISIGNNLQGAIHELTLWNRARTVVEAQAAMYSSKAPSTPNLIGYWKFNEGKGSVAQDYARNRHMALSHENWYLNNENKAISLDGSSYLLLDIAKYSVNNEESYAFEMWFRGTAQSDTATLFSIGTNKLALLFAPNGNMVLQGNGVTHSITSENYLDNIWHHVALNVLRNGNAIVYVDGINVNQLDAALVPAMAGSHIVIGASGNRLSINTINYNKYFAGEVDEIRLWNATLTGEFLRNNSNVRLTGNNNGLVAYYPFEHQTLDANNQVITIGSLKDQAYHINDSIVTNATSNNAIVYASTAPAMIKAPAETNLKYSFVASDNTIVINLLDKASYLEQSTVNVTVYDVRDLANNLSQSISWKVYVNKNQLKWSDEEIAIKQLSTESETFTTSITNQSGLSEVWSITNMPSWLSADVSQGTLAALSSRNINFTVSPSTPIGVYEGIVYLSGTNQIYEPLIITLHVTGEEPIWDVDPSLYETSMNIIGQMQVVGLVSEDVNDKIAAFIDGECVGVASPVYYSRYDSYYVIMDVYGNSNLLGKEVKFKVWDASTGIVYPSVNTSSAVTYNANQLLGNMKNPFIWNAEDKIEQNVDLSSGWNWTSLYMTATDMSVPSLMQSIKSQVMVVKGKTSFTQPTAQGWAGSLSALEVGKMYKVQMSEQANLSMNGKAVDATTTPLTIYPNWNWIGYNASYNVSIADAFAGLDPEDGDQVKGQSGFALYQDYEWIGTLKTLIPGKGYMYQSQATTNKSFAYPSSEFASKAPQRTPRVQGVFNPVAENVYSGNMTMVALVKNNDEIISNCEVGVFSNDECRAAEMANENGLVFLTIAGEGSGLRLNFRVSINGTIHQIEKGIIYIDDSSIGTLDNPHIIQLVATDIQDIITENILVYPTVVSDKVFVESMYYEIQNIKLIDVNGRLIQSFDSNLKQRHEIDMTTCSEGVYLIIVDVNDGQQFIQKVVKTTNK